MKRKSNQSIFTTIVLTLVLVLQCFFLIGITISGPYYRNVQEEKQMIDKISAKEKNIIAIERHSFQYVTYTCETKNSYVIYDENGKKVLTRKKSELQLDKVKKMVEKQYPILKEQEIKISYGYKGAVYLLENKNHTMLMLDFDTLKKVFYMKEG